MAFLRFVKSPSTECDDLELQYRNAVSVMQIALDNKRRSLLGFIGTPSSGRAAQSSQFPCCFSDLAWL